MHQFQGSNQHKQQKNWWTQTLPPILIPPRYEPTIHHTYWVKPQMTVSVAIFAKQKRVECATENSVYSHIREPVLFQRPLWLASAPLGRMWTRIRAVSRNLGPWCGKKSLCYGSAINSHDVRLSQHISSKMTSLHDRRLHALLSSRSHGVNRVAWSTPGCTFARYEHWI